MKKSLLFVIFAVLIGGCAPKMGQDILVEPEGNIRWESSKTQVILGVLSLLGAPVDKEPIRLGSDLKITNKWHSDVKLVSLHYTLNDADVAIASGEVKADIVHPLIVPSGGESVIPISLRIDSSRVKADRLMEIVRAKRKLFVNGEAVIEVWGFQKQYRFSREATPLIQKALKKV